jgi:nicotinamide-nucleotide amidase
MNVEIISIGDELLYGKTINTNASWIGEQLSMIGFEIEKVSTISDKAQAIKSTVQLAVQTHKLVLITGGLGPTNDDITKQVLCELFQTQLEFYEPAYAAIHSFLKSRNGEMNENNKSQAWLPKDAYLIRNDCGTAWGMWFEWNNSTIISMPGVPFEMKYMMQTYIIPKLKDSFVLPPIVHRHILCIGIAEAKLAHVIAEWESQLPNCVHLAYLPSPGIVKLRLTVIGEAIEHAKQIISEQESKILPIIQEFVYGYDDDTLEELIGSLLIKKSATLSTAESCTGGNIASTIVKIPGSSQYFKGGIIAYSNDLKIQQLHISHDLLSNYGAVSKEVVEAMAMNCRRIYNTDFAIATSGIAGPTGGTEEKPVGTVWIAVASATNICSQKFLFGEHRERTILRTTIAALNLLQKNIE